MCAQNLDLKAVLMAQNATVESFRARRSNRKIFGNIAHFHDYEYFQILHLVIHIAKQKQGHAFSRREVRCETFLSLQLLYVYRMDQGRSVEKLLVG